MALDSGPPITLVVPTRNRAHTLRRVGESFYRQRLVSEVIFVDDGSRDDTPEVIAHLARRFSHVRTKVLRHDGRRGAAACRTAGYQNAKTEHVLFCDDDVYLEAGYAETCFAKMEASGLGIVSGRLVQKRADETPEAAIAAFGTGSSVAPPFRRVVCEFRDDARFDGDVTLPLTHSVILTRRSLLQKYGYDPYYARGNGYREESDFQMNAFVHGETALVTNDVHCVELSRQENPTGGQRVGRLQRLYWNVYYTNYFFRKYYDRYARRVGLRMPSRLAIVIFAGYQVYRQFLRPAGRLIAAACARDMRRIGHLPGLRTNRRRASIFSGGSGRLSRLWASRPRSTQPQHPPKRGVHDHSAGADAKSGPHAPSRRRKLLHPAARH